MNAGDNEIKGYVSVDDGYGVIGYHYYCECGNVLRFVGTGDVCKNCGLILPTDPDGEL